MPLVVMSACNSIHAHETPPGLVEDESLLWKNVAALGVEAALIGAYGKAHWWSDGFTGTFHKKDEGWFGQDTYQGGADKAGHMYFTYLMSRLMARGFEWIGNAHKDSSYLGAFASFGTMTAIEVLDGYSKKYSFSKEDAVMNLLGAGMALLLERNPELDELVDFRLRYRTGNGGGTDPSSDVSGQTYFIVAKATGIPALRNHPVLRYAEISVGYGTRGYAPVLQEDRSRHVYFGLSINLSEVLRRSVYRGDPKPSLTQKTTEQLFEYIQVPGSIVTVDHQLSR